MVHADVCPATDVRVIGHRGSGTNSESSLPENTIASVIQAGVDGADMVEIDVQLSLDGRLYVIHDDTVDRTTDGTGCVADLSASELDALSADGERVPTLEALLAATPLPLNIELKVNEEPSCPETDRFRLAAELLRVLALDPTPREVLITSFDLDQLFSVRGMDDSLPLGLLTTERGGFDTAIAERFDSINPLAAVVRAADVEAAHAAGLRVHPYTVNDEVTMRRLIGFGVDGIITDHPARLVAVQRAICAEACSDDPDVDGGPEGDGGADAGAADAAADAGGSDGGGGCSSAGADGAGAAFALCALVLRRRRARRSSRRP